MNASVVWQVGNHIDVQTGRWTAVDAGIGAGVDSYYEYLVKGAVMLQMPQLVRMFAGGHSRVSFAPHSCMESAIFSRLLPVFVACLRTNSVSSQKNLLFCVF